MKKSTSNYYKKVIGLLIIVMAGGFSAAGGPLLLSDSAYEADVPLSGRAWGYVFGDYYYKAHGDSARRGGKNQFTGISEGANAFDIRRVYLGYDFNISSRFEASVLLTAEDWNTETKLPFFVKYANVRWKNIWQGADLTVGLSKTPAFSGSSEKVWGYRSIEQTIADLRGTPSYDLGVSLKGRFDRKGNYGYFLMVGNGTGSRAEHNRFKKFYGSVFAYFLDKKLRVNLYADYERIHWQSGFHHSRNMFKLFVGYETASLAAGVEAFVSHGRDDLFRRLPGRTDTLDANATGLSLFVRGTIVKERLGFFARADWFNPYTGYQTLENGAFATLSSEYEPNTLQRFVTCGLDYSPVRNVHFMPNIWYTAYRDQSSLATGAAAYDYDLAYRMTFYFTFGK